MNKYIIYAIIFFACMMSVNAYNANCTINNPGCSPNFANVTDMSQCCSCKADLVRTSTSAGSTPLFSCSSNGIPAGIGSLLVSSTIAMLNPLNAILFPAKVTNKAVDAVSILLDKKNANEDQYRSKAYQREIIKSKLGEYSSYIWLYTLAILIMIVEFVKIAFYLIFTRLIIFLFLELLPGLIFLLRDNMIRIATTRIK